MRPSAVLAIASALLITTVLVSSFVTGVVPGMERANPLPPRPYASGSSAKTVVVEVGTGTWCPPCANADPAVSRIMDEYTPDRMIVLMYHVIWGRTDPYENTASLGRINTFYNIDNAGIPALVVDGGGPYTDATLWAVGAYSSKGQNYDWYRQKIDSEYVAGTSLAITLAADLTATRVNIDATITATDPPTQSNLIVEFVLYEDALYYMGTNGEPYHRAVVRDLRSQPFSIVSGETKTASDSFDLTLPQFASVNRNKLGVAVLVQTNTRTPVDVGGGSIVDSHEILQAARVDFVTPGITFYRDEPLTDYTEPYERLLSQDNRHFRTWDSLQAGETGANDIRGPPDAAGLAEHPMVIWSTGAQAAGALPAAEQALLQDQLTNGNGGLLLTGENLGVDVGATPFYADVLKASFQQDSSGIATVSGINGDPISSPWALSSLAVTGGSPDVVSTVGNGAVTFVYTGTAFGAAIRSDYDSDSRVLYMGYRYFEGPDAQRRAVLGAVIGWMDRIAGPAVTVGYPNGGETFISGTMETLRWDARDVEIPSTGVDLYFTADSGSPTWTLIAQNEPNDGVYRWDPPAGVDSDRCRLRIVVRDGQGIEREDISDADFTIGSPVQVPFSVILQPGANLVSFPVQPSVTVLTSVLSSIDPNFAWVRVYDATNPADPWVTWTRSGPANELTHLDRTMGFWVEVTSGAPVTLTVLGLRPSVTTVPLVAGWNLVGFPSGRTDFTVAMAKAASGATMVSGFDGTSPTNLRVMADTEFLLAGNGYWVYVPANRDWVVTY